MTCHLAQPISQASAIDGSHAFCTAPGRFNIASYLPRMAEAVPDQPAVIVQRADRRSRYFQYTSVTFRELEALSNRYANGLADAGFERGMRVLLLVKPGIEFTGLVFAIFRLGLVPVLIDPGMGGKRMLECVRSSGVQGFIGIPLAHAIRVLRRNYFPSVRCVVTVGRRWFWGGPKLGSLAASASADFVMADTRADETAAILFTSGSTGPAKGVVYEHGMFDAQVRAIQSCYGIEPGEIDLATFPLFALFDTAMGMTCVIPDMDASRPASVNPANIIAAIRDQRITSTFGSPALWNRVAGYGTRHGVTLPSLKRVLIAGAPVPYRTIEKLHEMLSPKADVYTPYGATESLPVSSISGREVIAECRDETRRGAGTCVGRPVPDAEVRIIRITDDPIETWSDDLLLHNGEIGEIIVHGPAVTRAYDNHPNAAAKIHDGDRIWQRIGDVGYRDDNGRLWFCGRKSHRVVTSAGTLFTEPCEAIFNEHPDIFRSALVGIGPRGRQRPVIIVEPRAGEFPNRRRTEQLRQELLALGAGSELTRLIADVLFHRNLPVDVRHNAKINREALAVWAERRLQ
jgi:acyl-CoA synthetase (AMP-forming)/AMP-acid ligase II